MVIQEKINVSGHHYFVILAGNGETLVVSEMYSSKQMCEHTMKLFKESAPKWIAKNENGEILFD